jgi:acyl-coenzyme A thioesterase PaaI-like protein
MSFALKAWNNLKGNVAGRWLFSRFVCFKAPYFASISPLFERLEAGLAEVSLKKRRKVTNHIGTVHAIAMANLCEIAAGTMMEASIPSSMRWIPKGMTIQYLAKAATSIRAKAVLPDVEYGEAQDVIVPVIVVNTSGTEVVRADITMYVSPKSGSNR